MPGKTLGLDINEDSITAVQVVGGLKGYQITACGHVRIQGEGGLEDGLRRICEGVDLRSDTCVLSLPARHVSYRNLDMPFKDPRKIRKTLPYEIDSLLPLPIEELIVDFAIIDRSEQTHILAASIKKSTVSEYLTRLQAVGVDPEVLDVRSLPLVSWLLRREDVPENGILLDISGKVSTMALYLKRRIALIRTFALNGGHAAIPPADTGPTGDSGPDLESLSRMVRNTIHASGRQDQEVIYPEKIFFTGPGALRPDTGPLLSRFLDLPSEQVNLVEDRRIRMDGDVAQTWNAPLMDGALSLALREPKPRQGFNFRRDEFEVRGKYFGIKKELRKAAILIMLVLAFLAGDMGTDYYFMKERYSDLDQEIKKVFMQTFPDVKKVVDPLAQMKVRINQIKGPAATYPGMDQGRGVLDLLEDISKRIPRSLDVRIVRMIIDPEMVRMSGTTTTFNAVDNIKGSLESSPLFDQVTISSANLDRKGKKVSFEIKLKRGWQGVRS